MSRFLLLAVGSCLFMVSPLLAETTRIELKYVAVADILGQLVRGMSGLKTDEEIEALVKKGKAQIGGATVVIDLRENNMRLEGDADSLKRVWDFVKTVDVRPTQVRLRGVLMEVRLDNAIEQAVDVFGGNAANGIAIWEMFEGEKADLEALVTKAEASMRVEVRSRPEVICASNQEGIISSGVIGGEMFTGKITSLVNSAGEITLRMELVRERGGTSAATNTTIRLPVGATVAVGGLAMKDDQGGEREMLLLLQPSVVEGETVEEGKGKREE